MNAPKQATMTMLPNGAIHISDDEYIEAILLRNAYTDKLSKMPGKNFVGWTWQNELAYCLVTRDYGHLLECDNGYSMLIMPKEVFSDEHAADFVKGVCTRQAEDAVFVPALGPCGN